MQCAQFRVHRGSSVSQGWCGAFHVCVCRVQSCTNRNRQTDTNTPTAGYIKKMSNSKCEKKRSLQIFKNARTTRWLVGCFNVSVSANALARAPKVLSLFFFCSFILFANVRLCVDTLPTGEILFRIAQVPNRLFTINATYNMCAYGMPAYMCRNKLAKIYIRSLTHSLARSARIHIHKRSTR